MWGGLTRPPTSLRARIGARFGRGGAADPAASVAAPPSAPPLLLRLRALDPHPDWRRQDEDPAAASLAAELAADGADWPEALRQEADALLAKARRDAAAAIEALCVLAAGRSARADWAMRDIARMAKRWTNIEGRLAGAEKAALRTRAGAALDRLSAQRPRARAPRLALAALVQAAHGPGAAADHLAEAWRGGAPVLDRWLRMAAVALEPGPSAEALLRARDLPDRLAEESPAGWAVFRLDRAVAFAMARAAPAPPADRAAVLAALPAEHCDIGAAMAAALALARGMGADDAAALLKGLAAGRLFCHAPMPEAEAARLDLRDALLGLCRAPGTHVAARRTAFLALSGLLPRTVRFWTDPAGRRAHAVEMIAQAGCLDEPERSLHRGLYAAAMEDHDLAAASFAAAGGPGARTHVDARAVPAILAARGDGPLLGEEGGTFEVVAAGTGRPAPIVIVAANDRYLRQHGAGFARRLAAVAPGSRLHLHLIGDPGAMRAEVAAIAAAGHGLGITLSSEPITINAPHYFATARFLRLGAWLDRFRGPIIVSDIDGRWQADPARFLDRRMGGADVGISLSAEVRIGRKAGIGQPVLVYPLPLPWTAVTAWPLALAPSPGARRFAELLSRLADARLRAAAAEGLRNAWFIDQNVLGAAYAHALRHEPGLSFADLGLPSEIGLPGPAPRLPGLPGRHWIAGG